MASVVADRALLRDARGMRDWDCIVVGGGAAGLSAALVLGRARRQTLVVDAGHPSNIVAEGVGGLLGHDGRSPAELYAAGRAELTRYPTVEVREGVVIGGRRDGAMFVLQLDDGGYETARRVLIATGMDYRYPDVPGIAERWGRAVFHCPFCHGWEVRDQPLGVLDRGAHGVLRSLLLRLWSDDVTLFSNGPAGIDVADMERLRAAGVAVDEREISSVVGPADTLTAVTFADGSERACRGLLVATTLHQRSNLAEQLGAGLAEPGPAVIDAIAVDPGQHTSVPGLSAAGDAASQMPSVAVAIAAGSTAAARLVHSLIAEDHHLAE